MLTSVALVDLALIAFTSALIGAASAIVAFILLQWLFCGERRNDRRHD